MLVSIIVLIVIFLVVRFLASRFTLSAVVYNSAGIIGMICFALGLATRAYVAPTPVVVAPPPGSAAGTSAIPAAATGVPATLVWQRHVFPVRKTPALLGSIDVLSASPNEPGTPGNAFSGVKAIYASGWAAAGTKTPLHRLLLVIDDHIVVDGTAKYRIPRPDVATAYRTPDMTNTGFRAVQIPVASLAKGAHSVRLGSLSDDGKDAVLEPAAATFTLN